MLLACLAQCVSADAGNDFSNNLFSDLAPYVPVPVPGISTYLATCSKEMGEKKITTKPLIESWRFSGNK